MADAVYKIANFNLITLYVELKFCIHMYSVGYKSMLYCFYMLIFHIFILL